MQRPASMPQPFTDEWVDPDGVRQVVFHEQWCVDNSRCTDHGWTVPSGGFAGPGAFFRSAVWHDHPPQQEALW